MRQALHQLLDHLECGDLRMVLVCAWRLKLRAVLKSTSPFRRYQPIRLMAAFAIVFPLTILIYQPTACQPEPQILTMWGVSLMGTFSLYKLMPG